LNNPHYSGPIQWARGNCALKRSVAARPGVFATLYGIVDFVARDLMEKADITHNTSCLAPFSMTLIFGFF